MIWRAVRFLLHEICLMKITASDIDDLALGAVFLATGGGGDPYLPTLIAKETLAQTGGVTLIDAQSLDDDAFVVPVGGVGAPTVSLELLPSVDEASKVLDRYEELIGRPITAVASFEIGGGNSLMPLMAAAVRGLPVVDGDGMGRAFPEAQMMSYAIAGVKPTPALAMDYAGNTAVFETSDTTTYEHHIRAFAAAAGGMITVAEHPMSGAQIKASVIPATVSFSLKLGRLLREQRGPIDDVLPALRRSSLTLSMGVFIRFLPERSRRKARAQWAVTTWVIYRLKILMILSVSARSPSRTNTWWQPWTIDHLPWCRTSSSSSMQRRRRPSMRSACITVSEWLLLPSERRRFTKQPRRWLPPNHVVLALI